MLRQPPEGRSETGGERRAAEMAFLKGTAVVALALVLVMGMSYWAAGRAKPVLDAAARELLVRKGVAYSFIELPLGTVHYRLEGPESGPLVILIHGFSVPSFVWDGYVKPLTAAGYRVLAFDNYGRGFSDRPQTEYNAGLTDRLLTGLLAGLGLEAPAHVIGYSMGGATAAIYAARHPEKVLSLGLIAPAGLGTALDEQAKPLLQPVIGDWIVRMIGLRIFHNKAAEEAKFAPNPAGFLADFNRQMDYAGYGEALLSTLRHYPLAGAEPVFAEAGRSMRPVLVIWGETDRTVPFVHAARLMALMPRAKLHSYPQFGHEIAYSKAPMMVDLIIDFLDAQGTGAGDKAANAARQPRSRIEARLPDR